MGSNRKMNLNLKYMIITFVIIYIITVIIICTLCYLGTKDKEKLNSEDKITLIMGLTPILGTIMITTMFVMLIKEIHKQKLQKIYSNSIYQIMYLRKND